jgi:hypothetical protein
LTFFIEHSPRELRAHVNYRDGLFVYDTRRELGVSPLVLVRTMSESIVNRLEVKANAL